MDSTSIGNGDSLPLGDCPRMSLDQLRQFVLDQVAHGGRIAAMPAWPDESAGGQLRLLAVIAQDSRGELALAQADLPDRYPAWTVECPQAHWFERELAEQWGVTPQGHPWLKPIRFSPRRGELGAMPTRPFAWACAGDEHARAKTAGVGMAPINSEGDLAAPSPHRPVAPSILPHPIGVTDFFSMRGDEVHEVAVGPVHAGIIEPGHFRFQCHGETVHHLEISLGYQHRGVERAMVGGPTARSIHYAETLAGDTTVGHAWAYCRAIESLSADGGKRVGLRAEAIRAIVLELERVANHIGDLGALAGDVGFLPTMSYCGRIRGDVLNMTAAICGNRFGRNLVRPGGVAFDLDPATIDALQARLDGVRRDATSAIELLWNTPSVMARFDGAGAVDRELARQIGLVGVAARASGLDQDVRRDFPYGLYCFVHVPASGSDHGDVSARAHVRWLEIQRSLAFLGEQLASLPEGEVADWVSRAVPGPGTVSRAVPGPGDTGGQAASGTQAARGTQSARGTQAGSGTPMSPLMPNRLAVSMVEGWRGEICHVAVTDAAGHLASYKVVDPSFHNWFGLACALRGQQISDFPLCNKSFNLSYCGHDL